MKKIMVFLLFSLVSTQIFPEITDPQDLLKKAEEAMYPENFFLRLSLTTEKPDGEKKVTVIETLHKKDTGSLMEILKPSRSKGIKFLQKDKTLWMYNPKSSLKKAIRLSPKGSFEGSVFSNNDIGDPDYSDDYTTVLEPETVLDHPDFKDAPCYVIKATAKNEEVPYGEIRMWVRKEGLLPLKMVYYAKSGLPFKVMTLAGYKKMAGRLRPSLITMTSLENKDTVSIVEMEKMEVRNSIPDSLFTETALTR
ncbi:MAG: outer membrane lipoprotein-sorting protein [Spirochaetales bacterium]|nr:outer membrane lipoprotein-sorting protein [Spirochaetales bacterium]